MQRKRRNISGGIIKARFNMWRSKEMAWHQRRPLYDGVIRRSWVYAIVSAAAAT